MRQYAPRIQVMLYEVFSGSGSLDVTDWLGDQCVIRTSKSIFEPFGTFTISFLDKPVDGESSLYSRVAPMDALEIRAAHDGSKNLKVLMRGFVASVRREESVSSEGKPVRHVVISCQDVGVLWTTQFLHFLPYPEEQAMILSGYGVLLKYFGAAAKNVSGASFLGAFVDVLDAQLRKMLANSALGMSLAPAPEGEGSIPVQRVQQPIDEAFYTFLSRMLDRGAFYELWIDDPGYGDAQVRWRELWSGPAGETVTQDDVQSVSVWRDHSRVSNWYWCWPTSGALIQQTSALIEAMRLPRDSMDARQYHACSEDFFGWRKLEVHFSLLPPGLASNTDAPHLEQVKEGEESMTKWLETKNRQLQRLNRDNAELESCVMRVAGNEDLRPGTWITYQKAEATFRYYATRVEHEINLWGGFTSTISGERGVRWSGRGSYHAELDLKGAAG